MTGIFAFTAELQKLGMDRILVQPKAGRVTCFFPDGTEYRGTRVQIEGFPGPLTLVTTGPRDDDVPYSFTGLTAEQVLRELTYLF